MPPRTSPRKRVAASVIKSEETKVVEKKVEKGKGAATKTNKTKTEAATTKKAKVPAATTTKARKRKAVKEEESGDKGDVAEQDHGCDSHGEEAEEVKKPAPKKRKTKKDKEDDMAPLAERTAVSSLKKAMYIGAHVSAAGGMLCVPAIHLSIPSLYLPS